MATLTIRKKSLKTWVHQFSDMPENITSKFYFTIDGEYFRIVEIGQEKRNKYKYTDITIIDDVTSTTYDNFSSITELSLQLEALKYPAFQRDYILNTQLIELQDVEVTSVENGQVLVYEDGVWKNQNQSGGSGGSEDLQQVLENGASYTANGKTISIFENGIQFFDVITQNVLDIGLGDAPNQIPFVVYTPNAGGQTSIEFPLTETTEEVAYKSYVDTELSNKVDKVTGKQLSTEDYTTAEKSKLAGISSGATANDTDANLKNRANHTGSQAISTITGLQDELDAKDIKHTELNLLNDYALSSITTAQKLFNVGTSGNGAFSLDANSLYEFEMFVYLDNLSTTSSNFSFQILGTATYSNILLKTEATKQAFQTGNILNGIITATTSYQLLTNSIASTGFIKITGSFRTSSAGTFIPSILLSVANAANVKKGSYAKIKNIGSDTFTATSGIS